MIITFKKQTTQKLGERERERERERETKRQRDRQTKCGESERQSVKGKVTKK